MTALTMNPVATFAQSFNEMTLRASRFVVENRKGLLMMAVIAVLMIGTLAFAGTTASEFEDVYTKIKDWTQGYLGKSIALFAFLLGLGFGVAKSSPVPAISGIVFALFVAFGPAVLEGIATATI